MMSSVCLIVAGIAGQFCASPATLIGDCVEMNYEQYLCIAQEQELPVFLSVYDPALCAVAPINCDGTPDFGTGIPFSEAWYEAGVACPVDWVWSVVTVEEVGEWRCIDTGGRMEWVNRRGQGNERVNREGRADRSADAAGRGRDGSDTGDGRFF